MTLPAFGVKIGLAGIRVMNVICPWRVCQNLQIEIARGGGLWPPQKVGKTNILIYS